MAASQPAPDGICVHADARPGNKAVWNNRARLHHQMVWEVVARHGDDVEVTLAWRDEAGSPGSERSGPHRHFIVAPDGTVKRAFARNHKTGAEVPMRVAAAGEGITQREMTMLSTPLQHDHDSVLVTSLDSATLGSYAAGSSSPLSLANTLRQLDPSDHVKRDFELHQAREGSSAPFAVQPASAVDGGAPPKLSLKVNSTDR